MRVVRLAVCLGICFCIGIHAVRAQTCDSDLDICKPETCDICEDDPIDTCDICADDFTTAPAGSTTTITQKATFGYAASEHTGALKTAVDQGYGYAIQIFDKAALTYKTGCSVDSVAAGARRASTVVTFTALVNSANSAAAQVAAQALTKTSLQTAVNNIIATTGVAVTPVSVTGVAKPVIVVGTASGESSTGLTDTAIIVIVIIAALVVIGIIVLVAVVSTASSTQKPEAPAPEVKDDIDAKTEMFCETVDVGVSSVMMDVEARGEGCANTRGCC